MIIENREQLTMSIKESIHAFSWIFILPTSLSFDANLCINDVTVIGTLLQRLYREESKSTYISDFC